VKKKKGINVEQRRGESKQFPSRGKKNACRESERDGKREGNEPKKKIEPNPKIGKIGVALSSIGAIANKRLGYQKNERNSVSAKREGVGWKEGRSG